MPPIFMFPGQSSKDSGMLHRIVAASPTVTRPLVDRASTVLGRDLLEQYSPRHPAPFASNRDVQVGVFVASHLHLAAVLDAGIEAPLSLGLSLGEYNHLVHIGALTFEEALRLVDARGEAYDNGPDGAMAAVFPIELDVLEEVVVRARAEGVLGIGNLNSPMQHVLSGERSAIDAALAILEDEHFIEGRIIEMRIPMHSARFAPAADLLRPALERAPWKTPTLPYFPNVLGEIIEHATPRQIIESLYRHVYSAVQWRKSIELVTAQWPDAVFIEVGPGTVLFNLLQRKWRQNTRYATDGREGLREYPSAAGLARAV